MHDQSLLQELPILSIIAEEIPEGDDKPFSRGEEAKNAIESMTHYAMHAHQVQVKRALISSDFDTSPDKSEFLSISTAPIGPNPRPLLPTPIGLYVSAGDWSRRETLLPSIDTPHPVCPPQRPKS